MPRFNHHHPLQSLVDFLVARSGQAAEPQRKAVAPPALPNGGLRIQVFPLEEV
jgi:hypothetical protein